MKKIITFILLLAAPLWADTTTPRLHLTLPTVGSLFWGSKLNTNFQILDSTITNISDASSHTFTSTNTFTSTTTFSGPVVASTVTVQNLISAYPVVDPRYFGAVADGVTNDSVAIQAAHDSIVNSRKQATLLLTGRYKCNSGLTFNMAYVKVVGPAVLDFSSITTGAEITVVSSNTNSYFTNPYYNGDTGIYNITTIGPGRSTTTATAYLLASQSEPGPSHITIQDSLITQVGIGMTISSNSYIVDLPHTEFWENGIALNIPSTTNSGERIVLNDGAIYNSSTAALLLNGNADVYFHNMSVDGISDCCFYHGAGGLFVTGSHNENLFSPSYTNMRYYYNPPGTTNLFAVFDDDWFLVKSTHTYPVFDLKSPGFLAITNSHQDGTSSISSATIQTSSAGGHVYVTGVLNTMNDPFFNNVGNTSSWIQLMNLNGISTSQTLSLSGLTNTSLRPGVLHSVAVSSAETTGLVSMSTETTGAFISSVNVSGAFSVTANGANNTAVTLSANASSTTLQGNTFNGVSQLVQTNASSKIVDTLLTSNVDLLASTQTMSASKTFDGGAAIKGTVTGANQSSGYFAFVSSANAINVPAGPTGQFVSISTSASLPAGRFLVTGCASISGNTITATEIAVSANPGNTVTDQVSGQNQVGAGVPTAATNVGTCITYIFNKTSTWTAYTKAQFTYAGGSPTASGSISVLQLP